LFATDCVFSVNKDYHYTYAQKFEPVLFAES